MIQETQICTFRLGEFLFGVGVKGVQEVICEQAMTPVPLAPPVVRGLINLRGQIVTALDLRRRLGLPEAPPGRRCANVVVKAGDDLVSLLVDEIGDILDVDPASFEGPPEALAAPLLALTQGVCKLKDRLLVILDTDKVADVGGRRA